MNRDEPHHDAGLYIVWMKLTNGRKIKIGSLGPKDFPPGIYAYVGSAQRHRAARLRRHLRTGKRLHWHIDYLREHASVLEVTCLDGDRSGECRLAHKLQDAYDGVRHIPRFGAGDCRCPGHLLYFPSPPHCLAQPELLDPKAFAWHPE